MSEIRKNYSDEFKKNAVKLSYASPKSTKQVARDIGIGEGLLYRWRRRYTADGDKTRYASLEENRALQLRNAELEIDIDMLKKASVYFASLHR